MVPRETADAQATTTCSPFGSYIAASVGGHVWPWILPSTREPALARTKIHGCARSVRSVRFFSDTGKPYSYAPESMRAGEAVWLEHDGENPSTPDAVLSDVPWHVTEL
jgi:hypothetical protein